MKKRFHRKSIYARFAIIFLGIWWLLNSLTFGVVFKIMSNTSFSQQAFNRSEFFNEFKQMRTVTSMVFLISAVLGTIMILFAVRSVVKPIKLLSRAAKDVAKGDFEIEVEVKSTDEIGQLTTDFNLMTKELRNIDIMRKDFVSNVSHEFKTPITSIKGFAKLIRDGELSNDQLLEYSEIIVDESERLSLLSSNLLKISELDSKVIREQSKMFSLDEQIRKTILILENSWSKKEIEFDIELEKTFITGDEHLLHEVWLNLIQNAIKFSEQKGVIKIGLYKEEDTVKVEITDHGTGIAEIDKEHIFKRFYTGDKSRSKHGNGLGLVIAKKIVEISNGKIYFESSPEDGTSFFVELPL